MSAEPLEPQPSRSDLFAIHTAVRPAGGGWVGEINPAWNVGNNPNGGYTLALAARAMMAACGRPDPLTVTAHYVAPPVAGPVEVRTETIRAGRRYATVGARMLQGERELLRLIGAFGDLGALEGPTRIAGAAPRIPPPDECVGVLDATGGERAAVPEFMRRFDLRLDPGCQWVRARRAGGDVIDVTAAGADPAAPLEVAGWLRFGDGAPPSMVGLLAMADAFPPTLLGSLDVGWVPTVELTVHVRARPVPGWILGHFRTRFLVDGVLEEDGELWDSKGHLVALSRQMALVLPKK